MRKKSVIIHVGLEKTGTTSIQTFLFNNAKKLRSKSVYYPTNFGVSQASLSVYSGQPRYTNGLLSKMKKSDAIRGLPELIKGITNNFEKSNCKYLLFSNEHLSSRLKSIDDLNKLKALFHHCEYQIKIVMYIRNQVDLLESLYFEGVKSGVKVSLSDWAKNFSYFELDFAKMLESWESVFGLENITIRLFDKKTLKNGDVISDFLDLMSVSIDESFVLGSNENSSAGFKSIEFMREYNSNIDDANRQTRQLSGLLDDYHNDEYKITLPEDSRVQIFNRYNSSNHIFLEKYLPEIPYDYFVRPARTSNEVEFSESARWDIVNHIIGGKAVVHGEQQLDQSRRKGYELARDPWYRFGQMSNDERVWVIGKLAIRRLGIHTFLKTVMKYTKALMGK